jgi:hypothetical protein
MLARSLSRSRAVLPGQGVVHRQHLPMQELSTDMAVLWVSVANWTL